MLAILKERKVASVDEPALLLNDIFMSQDPAGAQRGQSLTSSGILKSVNKSLNFGQNARLQVSAYTLCTDRNLHLIRVKRLAQPLVQVSPALLSTSNTFNEQQLIRQKRVRIRSPPRKNKSMYEQININTLTKIERKASWCKVQHSTTTLEEISTFSPLKKYLTLKPSYMSDPINKKLPPRKRSSAEKLHLVEQVIKSPYQGVEQILEESLSDTQFSGSESVTDRLSVSSTKSKEQKEQFKSSLITLDGDDSISTDKSLLQYNARFGRLMRKRSITRHRDSKMMQQDSPIIDSHRMKNLGNVL